MKIRSAAIIALLALATSVRAQTNGVLLFDGVNDHLAITRPVSDSFTIEAWIQPTSLGYVSNVYYLSTPVIDNHNNDGVNDYALYFESQRPGFGVDGVRIAHSAYDVTIGRWVHIAATRNKATGLCEFFINGIKTAEGTASTATLSGQSTTWIGYGHWIAHEILNTRFVGAMDEIRFWNRVLTPGELQTNMFKVLAGNESGLVAYYNFDANNFNDKTTSANHATPSGSPVIVFTNSFAMSPFITAGTVSPITGVGFQTQPNAWYALQYNTQVTSSNWVDAGLRVFGDGGTKWFFDPAGFTPTRFYRVQDAPLYDTIRVTGTFIGWGGSYYLDRISYNTWQGDISMTNQTAVEFKFVANDNWPTSWGESDQTDFTIPISGNAEYGTPSNIVVQGTMNGTFRFTFNDQFGAYTVTQIAP